MDGKTNKAPAHLVCPKCRYEFEYNHARYDAEIKRLGAEIYDIVQQLSENRYGQYTGLTDMHDNKIFTGHITRLVLPGGEVRHFVVDIKTVVRTVRSHPDFDDPTARVAITGVVFSWRGFDLFPCVDDDGVPDNKRMEIVGNVHDNPELIESEGRESHGKANCIRTG